MAGEMTQRNRKEGGLMAGVLGVLMLSLGGCASEPPKSVPTVTQDQVRSHSDKAFEELKQEEQNHAADPAMTR